MRFVGKKAISTLMFTLLLTSMLTLAFSIQPVKATGGTESLLKAMEKLKILKMLLP